MVTSSILSVFDLFPFKNKYLFLVILIVLGTNSFSMNPSMELQDNDSVVKNQLNIGSDFATILLFNSYTLSIEHLHMRHSNKVLLGYGLNAGGMFGTEFTLFGDDHEGIDYNGFIVQPKFYLLLKGERGNYFELNVGAGWVRSYSTYSDYVDDLFMPEVSVGFRKYLNLSKGIFRIGASLPRGIYIGYAIRLH